MNSSAIQEFHNKIMKSQISESNKSILLSNENINDVRNYITLALEIKHDVELDWAYSLLPGQQVIVVKTVDNINLN